MESGRLHPLGCSIGETVVRPPSPACLLLVGPTGSGRKSVVAELQRGGRAFLSRQETTGPVPLMANGSCRQVDQTQFQRRLRARDYLNVSTFDGTMTGTPIAEVADHWRDGRLPVVLCSTYEAIGPARRRLIELDQRCAVGIVVLTMEPTTAWVESLRQLGPEAEDRIRIGFRRMRELDDALERGRLSKMCFVTNRWGYLSEAVEAISRLLTSHEFWQQSVHAEARR